MYIELNKLCAAFIIAVKLKLIRESNLIKSHINAPTIHDPKARHQLSAKEAFTATKLKYKWNHSHG